MEFQCSTSREFALRSDSRHRSGVGSVDRRTNYLQHKSNLVHKHRGRRLMDCVAVVYLSTRAVSWPGILRAHLDRRPHSERISNGSRVVIQQNTKRSAHPLDRMTEQRDAAERRFERAWISGSRSLAPVRSDRSRAQATRRDCSIISRRLAMSRRVSGSMLSERSILRQP